MEKNELIVSDRPSPLAAHPDPVIESKRLALQRMMDLHNRGFKRVDIQLLQMRSPFDDSYPIFAVQTIDDYERHVGANVGSTGYSTGGRTNVFREVLEGCQFAAGSATPKGSIPQSAKALVQQHGREFDNLYVVWDASREWTSPTPAEVATVNAAADPLILGDVDGVWFCVAKWDLTKLESYFVE